MSEQNDAVIVRKATLKDVEAISQLVNAYASQGQMLPRSHHWFYQNIRDFVVAMHGEELVGVGALHVVWEDIGEVRSLAVVESWRGKGVGRMMIDLLKQEARALGLPRLFALTYRQAFFERMGFHVVPRESLPHKIWGDCLDCPKFPNCDEIALIIQLDQTGASS